MEGAGFQGGGLVQAKDWGVGRESRCQPVPGTHMVLARQLHKVSALPGQSSLPWGTTVPEGPRLSPRTSLAGPSPVCSRRSTARVPDLPPPPPPPPCTLLRMRAMGLPTDYTCALSTGNLARRRGS